MILLAPHFCLFYLLVGIYVFILAVWSDPPPRFMRWTIVLTLLVNLLIWPAGVYMLAKRFKRRY